MDQTTICREIEYMADIGTVSDIMHKGLGIISNLLHSFFEGFRLLKIACRTTLNYSCSMHV